MGGQAREMGGQTTEMGGQATEMETILQKWVAKLQK